MAPAGLGWAIDKNFTETTYMKQYRIRTKYQTDDAASSPCVISAGDPLYADCYPELSQAPSTGVSHIPGTSVNVDHGAVGDTDDQAP